MFDEDETPAERLHRWASIEWYVVTFKGINADGEPDTIDVQMSGDIEATVDIWARHKGWANTEIINKQYIGKVPEQKH